MELDELKQENSKNKYKETKG